MSRLGFLLLLTPLVAVVGCQDKDDEDDDDDDDDDNDGGGGGGVGSDGWGGDGDTEESDGSGSTDSGWTDEGGGTHACREYVDAWSECVYEFGGNPSDYGLTEGFCDTYDDRSYDALFYCYADALIAGDCSTVEGYTEAATEAASCT